MKCFGTIVMLTLCVAASAARAQPATAPAAQANLTDLIKSIEAAAQPGEVVALYAQARALAPESIPLHRLYMVRMLELGYPRIAAYPAATLARLNPKDASAWGLIAYQRAKIGQRAQALDPAVRAAALNQTDPAILHNAAALLAWREATSGSLPPGTAATLAKKHQDRWMTQRAFSTVYQQVLKSTKARQDKIETLKSATDTQDQALKQMVDESRQIDAEARRNNAEFANRQEQIRRTRPEVETLRIREDRGSSSYSMRDRRRALEREIREHERRIAALRRDNDRLAKKLQGLRQKYDKAKDKLDQTQSDLRQAQLEDPLEFNWQVPAVDGRTFTDLEADGTLVPFAAGDVDPDDAAATPADKADSLLSMAKMLQRNNRPGKAADTLKTLIEKYPQTPAADDAREMLQTLGKP